MKKEDLLELKNKIKKLSYLEDKLRDLYLKDISEGRIYGPMTGYASIDKPWLKNYDDLHISRVMPKKTIYQYAHDNNIDYLDATAINFLGFKISFEEFFKKVDEVANSFTKLGVKEGDVVSICSPTFPETIYANFALNKIGAIANNIDPRNNAKRILESVNSTKSNYLIVLDIAKPKIDSVLNEMGVINVICNSYIDSVPMLLKPIYKGIIEKKLEKKGLKTPIIEKDSKYLKWEQFIKIGKGTKSIEVPYKENRVAAMVLTGGTTGFPKTVQLTNENALSLVESYLATDLGLKRGQSLLNIMPEFIAYGWAFGVVMATCLGIENIVISQFDIDEFPDYIKKYQPNHIVGVPTHCDYLIDDERMKNVDFSKFLKSISVGGDSYNVEHEKEFNKFLKEHKFSGKVIMGYGMTEGTSSMATRLNKNNITGSVGIPLVKNNVAIFSNDSECQELSYNQEGEVCISGPSLMKGYHLNDEETNNVLRVHSDGTLWLHSRDIGYINEDGVIFIKGREKRVVIRPDGHNVWPSEMERVLSMHPYVDNCAVFGLPSDNDLQGEYPHAVIVLKDDANYDLREIEKALRKYCLENLPERDVPYTYSFKDELTLTNIGKVDIAAMKNEILNYKIKIKKKDIK